jgi:hypothetical protein
MTEDQIERKVERMTDRLDAKFITCTIESGETYRICERTGETRQRETANMFSGSGASVDEKVRVWEILHPDDPATEYLPSPYGAKERPAGVGKFLGEEWL